MKNVISISEARKNLPAIIKSLKAHPAFVYQITVHNEVVAEIKTPPMVKPGEAAGKILALRKRLGPQKYKAKPVSENIGV